MNSKITKIEFKNEWANPKGGSIFYHYIELEDGSKGQIGAKSKLPEKLSVGSQLDYEKTTDEKGQVRIKAMQLPNNVFKGAVKDPAFEEKKQRMIIAQSSMSSAVQYFQQRQPTSSEDIFTLATKIYNWVTETSK